MAPRNRLKRNQGLQPNLYSTQSAGRTYYTYRRPTDGKRFGLGSDKRKANAIARQANAQLMEDKDRLAQVLGTNDITLSEMIALYQDEILGTKTLAEQTRRNAEYRLARFKQDLGDRVVSQFDVGQIASYLDQFKRDSYVKHRGQMVELFRFAKRKGWFPDTRDNPAELTYSKMDYGKHRRRMTLQQFRAIHQQAPHWMQIAMELAIVTLQGRYEVCHMRYDDLQDDQLYVVREKTKKNEWGHLRIPVTPALEDIIRRSRDDVVSPFIVHRAPAKRKRASGKQHWTQLTLNDFSAKFRKVRDQVPELAAMASNERPSFHEIRALGSWLYEQAGFERDYVQALMAHGDEKMTAHYQSGHQKKWVDVRADMDLKTVFDTR